MTGPVEALGAGNIVNPDGVVRIAAAAGLELAAAAALLQMESGGGRNVWGHDGVQTGGAYVKGAAVTREAYEAYLKIRDRLGSQGVGPTQLTYGPFQDRADRLGGCWRWDVNCRVGFEILAELIGRYGIQTGFQRYNGSGPAAVAYGQRAVRLYDGWRARLANTDEGDDVALSDDDIAKIAEAVWRRATLNSWGDWVGADQILIATERRIADGFAELRRRPAPESTETPPVPPL